MSRRNPANAATDDGHARVPFDSSVWQLRDSGDFIHTKTGEVRDEDGFLSAADGLGLDSEESAEDWDSPQDAGGWDDTGDHTALLGDDGGGGSHGFDDSAQVRTARSASSDPSDDRPSKLAPKKKRK